MGEKIRGESLGDMFLLVTMLLGMLFLAVTTPLSGLDSLSLLRSQCERAISLAAVLNQSTALFTFSSPPKAYTRISNS